MRKYEHIIWDWNGTLIDDAWLCVEILNKILHQYNKPLTNLERYRTDFSFPVKEYYEDLGFDFSIESFETIAAEYIAEYDARCFECSLQEEAEAVLRSCAEFGVTQSVLSACQQHRLEQMLEYYNISGYFTIIAGLDDHYAFGKVEKAKSLISQLAVPANSILLVGDTVHDFEVAKAIGTDCVLIPSGHHSLQKLHSCGVKVLDSLQDTLSLPGLF